jgi:hypothetical protein
MKVLLIGRSHAICTTLMNGAEWIKPSSGLGIDAIDEGPICQPVNFLIRSVREHATYPSVIRRPEADST